MNEKLKHILLSNTARVYKVLTPVEQVYVSLLKHGDEAEVRDSGEPDTVRIHFIDPDHEMDGFTLMLGPFDEP